jgi:lysophospholipase L1-like esterase
MKTILCYGDSNTWGFVPGSMDLTTGYRERYGRDIRWTCRLQKLLGENYRVIDEGLSSRTTNIEYPEGAYLGTRNAKPYLEPCLGTHAPIDLVVLLLGANDLKAAFNRSAEQIAAGLEDLVQLIQRTKHGSDLRSAPKVLVIAYPFLTQEQAYNGVFKGGVAKSRQLPALYEALAKRNRCEFLDVSQQVVLSEIDGCHLDEANHERFAKLLAEKIRVIEL